MRLAPVFLPCPALAAGARAASFPRVVVQRRRSLTQRLGEEVFLVCDSLDHAWRRLGSAAIERTRTLAGSAEGRAGR